MNNSRSRTGIAQNEDATEQLDYQMYKMSLEYVICKSKEAIKYYWCQKQMSQELIWKSVHWLKFKQFAHQTNSNNNEHNGLKNQIC